MAIIHKTVIVREQELRVSIGVHAHEKLAPQRLLVSVEVDVESDTDEADDIAATFDYDAIYAFVKSQESAAHSELQETVARRVLAFVLARPGVIRAVVETRKPDVFEDCAFVGIRLHGAPDRESAASIR